MQHPNDQTPMSSEAAPTKDSAWEDFRALYLDYRQFVMIDARLMLDKTTPHPLAGVVGRVVVEPGRVVRLEIPPELAAATDAIGGAASELGVRSLMPLPAYMVERNKRTEKTTWCLSAAGVAMLRLLNIAITDASMGIFDA